MELLHQPNAASERGWKSVSSRARNGLWEKLGALLRGYGRSCHLQLWTYHFSLPLLLESFNSRTIVYLWVPLFYDKLYTQSHWHLRNHLSSMCLLSVREQPAAKMVRWVPRDLDHHSDDTIKSPSSFQPSKSLPPFYSPWAATRSFLSRGKIFYLLGALGYEHGLVC